MMVSLTKRFVPGMLTNNIAKPIGSNKYGSNFLNIASINNDSAIRIMMMYFQPSALKKL